MPVYGYECPDCKQGFEKLQRMSDPPQAACPECGGPGRRLFLPVGVVFKGPGFYATDSRSVTPLGHHRTGHTAEAGGLGR